MVAGEAGEADIRGIDIDKLAKGFADEDNIFKAYCKQTPTGAREIRWFSKTSGFLDTADTTGITKSHIYNQAEGALPFVVQQSWTRNTSYVRKFMADSEVLTMEDIKDSDVDVLGTHIRDIVRGVARKVDLRIYAVLVEATEAAPTVPAPSNTNNGGATADGWNDASTGDPITDILTMDETIRGQGYNPNGAVLWMNQAEAKHLMVYLISTKGSSIPQFASGLVDKNMITEILGHPIVVSANYATDSVAMITPGVTLTWKTFMPMTAVTIVEPGIGTKVRAWEEGECIMTDPKSAYILTDTIV